MFRIQTLPGQKCLSKNENVWSMNKNFRQKNVKILIEKIKFRPDQAKIQRIKAQADPDS